MCGQHNVMASAGDNTGQNTDKGHTSNPRTEIKIPDPVGNRTRAAAPPTTPRRRSDRFFNMKIYLTLLFYLYALQQIVSLCFKISFSSSFFSSSSSHSRSIIVLWCSLLSHSSHMSEICCYSLFRYIKVSLVYIISRISFI